MGDYMDDRVIRNPECVLVVVARFLMEQEFLFARGRLESAGSSVFAPMNTSAGSAPGSITG